MECARRTGSSWPSSWWAATRPLIEAISAAWARIGVQAAAQPVTLAGLTTDFLVPRSFDAAVVDWELSGDPDPYPLWHSTQIKDGQNYAGWSDPAADEAIEQARAITDQAARRQFYVEFQRIFGQQVPALLLYHPIYTYGVRDKVTNVQIGPLNMPGRPLPGLRPLVHRHQTHHRWRRDPAT